MLKGLDESDVASAVLEGAVVAGVMSGIDMGVAGVAGVQGQLGRSEAMLQAAEL